MADSFNAKSARSKRPLPLWVDAFHRDTQDLSAEEIGAYVLILAAMWSRESCDLANDDVRLARVCRISPTLWKRKIGPKIMGYFAEGDGFIWSEMLRKEAKFVELSVSKQSNRKKGNVAHNVLKTNNVPQSADNPRTNHGQAVDQPTQLPNNPTVKKDSSYELLSPDADALDDAAKAIDAYNLAASESGWPKVQVRTKARVAAVKARMRESGGLSGWLMAIERAQASSHCCGRNQRGWTADFDFISRQSSFAKIMEGNYDDRAGYSKADTDADALRGAIVAAGSARKAPEPDFF